MGSPTRVLQLMMAVMLMASSIAPSLASYDSGSKTHYLDWTVETTNVTRNCETVAIATVNGMFPGPTVEVNEGDKLIIKVTNKVHSAMAIHWHGIKQMLTNWADGVASVTQCPLEYGDSYTYEFTVADQRGTFLWHAHVNWMRATVYGAFIVHPKTPPPYETPTAETTILFGEWFDEDPNLIEEVGLAARGLRFRTSTANLINGQPGPLYGNCSTGATVLSVLPGKTYLLRLINAALNNNHFFKVANHLLTVVAADGNYLKPFSTPLVVVSPGQTTDVLLKADQPIGEYYFGISEWRPFPVDGPGTPSLAIVKYVGSTAVAAPAMPVFPSLNDSALANSYTDSLRGWATYTLPRTMDRHLEFVAGITHALCAAGEGCKKKVAATINNVTFPLPTHTSLLQAYLADRTKGVYTSNFPSRPPMVVNYTSSQPLPQYMNGTEGTRVTSLRYGETVQLVLQVVEEVGSDDHPFHLHGHDFYVVAQGLGNYNASIEPDGFNLVDPPKRNTVGLPAGGWVVIRFKANNPGMWLFHCHIERHTSWGMMTAFVTANGRRPGEKLPSPAQPFPKCPNP